MGKRKGDDSSEDDPLPNKKHKKEKKDKDGAESKLKKDSKEKKDKDKKDKKEKKEKHKHGDDDEEKARRKEQKKAEKETDPAKEKHKKLESEELRPAQAPPAPAEPKRVVGPQAFPPEAEPKDKKQKKDKKDKKSKAGPVATREVQLCSANAFKDRSRPFGMELDGALVVDLADGGAAIPAGVQIGWRVLEVDGKPVPEDDIGKAAEAVRKAEEKMANKSGKASVLVSFIAEEPDHWKQASRALAGKGR
mmetsp:Transcript_31038/g.72805  ORF Transcript_31038/g.72805 Transcript_31038/m.72805 type:complete len:249 (-) Transcript_31038:40-786(-)